MSSPLLWLPSCVWHALEGHHVRTAEIQPVHLMHFQRTIVSGIARVGGQVQAGEERVGRVELSVRGDVDQPAAGRLAAKGRLRGCVADQGLCAIHRGDGLGFLLGETQRRQAYGARLRDGQKG